MKRASAQRLQLSVEEVAAAVARRGACGEPRTVVGEGVRRQLLH